MTANMDIPGPGVDIQTLRKQLMPYANPDLALSTRQLISACVPYLGLWVLMGYLLKQGYPYWTILLPLLGASCLIMRIFIFFHDCAHGSFYASQRANRTLGYIIGALTFTPFEAWKHPHIIHHGTYADLDNRGIGDIWTLTLDEYIAAPWYRRIAYRIYRTPIFLFLVGPPILFFIVHRFPNRGDARPERYSVMFNNLAVLVIVAVAYMTIGLRTYLLIQLPITVISGIVGIWMFYVQHQFEGVYWTRHADWDPMKAALSGSSYYKLPKALQWITGNIGLHHVHHVQPRIPNYKLQAAYDATPVLQTVRPLTFRRSLKSLWLNLWDEKQKNLVRFP